MNITEKRFIECIKNWNFIIKKVGEDRTITLNNYWATGNILAMFFDYKQGNKKGYIKIYLDKNRYSKPLKVDVYLLREKHDILLKTFSDIQEFKLFLENLETEIKEVLE